MIPEWFVGSDGVYPMLLEVLGDMSTYRFLTDEEINAWLAEPVEQA